MAGKRGSSELPKWALPAVGAVFVLVVGVVIGVGLGTKAKKPAEPPMVIRVAPEPEPEPQPAAAPAPPPPAEGGTAAAVVEPFGPSIPLPAFEGEAPQQVALNLPNWQRNAVPAPAVNGRAMIAIVIDDLGVDKRRSDQIVALPGPITTAFMSYARNLPDQARAARARGHELMLHMPMEPLGDLDAGPDVLKVAAGPEAARQRLEEVLERIKGQGFVGLNNHMGSKFTAYGPGMQVVMEELRERGLLFLDSVTTDKSAGPAAARQAGVPFTVRNVFIDNDDSKAAVLAQLAKTEAFARKHGVAVAIGHPHDGTIEALRDWLPSLEAKGLVLVPVSTIVKHAQAGRG